MEKKYKKIKNLLIESINNFPLYIKYNQSLSLLLKENPKYEKNILKYYNPEKDEKYIKMCFLFFFHYEKWINPYKINIFPFEEHFKMIKNDDNDKLEQLIINKFDNENIIKIYVYWLFYLSMQFKFTYEINNNIIIYNLQDKQCIINEIKNIFIQTNNKILNSYKIKKINIEQLFIFLYIYLFQIEYYTKIIFHEKQLKIFNSILLSLLFDLFQKITIHILSETENIEQAKKNMIFFNSFLDELKNNSLLHNDYNIIILLDNNIIQNYIEKILIYVNPKIIEKIFPEFSSKIADFFSTFIKFRFNKSRIMDFLINNTKNSFVELKYFINEKEKIYNDIFIQNFQSNLIQKIFAQETKKLEHPDFNSFLFNGNNSKMCFKLGKLNLNDNIIIFSFYIKQNINDNSLFNTKQPLICLYNYNKEIKFKLILKKFDSTYNDDTKNKLNPKPTKTLFLLSIIYNNKNMEMALNELELVESNLTYFICIHLNNSLIRIYLSSSLSNSKLLKSFKEVKMNNKEDSIILNIGNDKNDYFSGYIGNFYIIKLYNIKNKIDYENNKFIIENILQLKEFYKYIIFYLNLNNNLENKNEYILDYVSFYKNQSETWNSLKILESIKNNCKNYYEIILSISPGIFKFLNFEEKDNVNYRIPIISGICEKQREYSFEDINITFVKFDYSKDIFLMKNGLNYFCLQFEYFFQFANYYHLFMNKMQQKELDKEINDSMKFYQENIDMFMKLIKISINNTLLVLLKYIVDLRIINFSVVLKQIFSILLATMKALNSISNIIDPIFHQISGIIIIICEKISEIHNYLSMSKNKISLDDNKDLKFLISFRDGLIDILLTKEFYTKSTPQFIEFLFDKTISIIESSNTKDITITYPNIFLKILNFSSLLSDSFLHHESNIIKNNSKTTKTSNSILKTFLKLIKGLIIRKNKNSNDDIFYKQLFIFSLRDNKNNPHITYTFLKIIHELLKDGFSLDEKELTELSYYFEEINNKEIDSDLTIETNEKKDEKFKNDLLSLILTILLNNIFDKNIKQNFNNFCNLIKQNELNDFLFLSIINETIRIFSNNLDFKNMSAIKNSQNNNSNKKEGSVNNNSIYENFDFMKYYEDLFGFILILFKKKFAKKEENNKFNPQNNENENEKEIKKDEIVGIINPMNRNNPNKIEIDLINLLFFIEETLSAKINNKQIEITTAYCLLNLIKFFHIITFDDKLIVLYKENKFQLLFRTMLDSCYRSKILYTNYYINPSEKQSAIPKTIPESIMDICIKVISSNIIKVSNKNNKIHQEIILNNDIILNIMKEIFLNEKKNKKENENKKRTLFCYNDIYRYIFSRKINNIVNELNRINKEKIFVKNFPKFGEELILTYFINNLLNKENQFKYNFITFNIEKIYKYNYNIEPSSSSNIELKNFFDTLLTKIINEHEILYELNKEFFFKVNTVYNNYSILSNKIEILLNGKKFDDFLIEELIVKDFSIKCNVPEFVISGLCENIKEKKKYKFKNDLNRSYIEPKPKKENLKNPCRKSLSTNCQNYNLFSPPDKEQFNSAKNETENINLNDSHSSSIATSSEIDFSHNEDAFSQNEDSTNNNLLNFSPGSGTHKEQLSSSFFIPSKTIKAFTHVKSNSNFSLETVLTPSNNNMNIVENHFKDRSNMDKEKQLLQDINQINNSCFFSNLDSMFLFNIKRDLMKNIFSINFIDTLFYDKAFIELQKIFMQTYEKNLQKEKSDYLNYPSKIKNFSNGIEPPLFVRPFNNIFEHKTFPITHQYFFEYIKKYKHKFKYQYIDLFQKQIIIPEEEKTCEYKCELIKVDYALYGNFIYSQKQGYFYFKKENFEDVYNSHKNDIYYNGIFSLSYMKCKEKEDNDKVSSKGKSKRLIPKEKNILILLSEIEEIVERRFLLMWQGLEIFLKDGRSYFFNLLNPQLYEKLKKYLLDNNDLKPIFHKKDYLNKNKLITKSWEKNIISTYEYLLLINKYASRSFNEPNQYYIFPWIINKFENLIYINNNEKILYEEKRKQSTNSNKDKTEINENNLKKLKSLRILKYPISLQTDYNRILAINRYSDDEEKDFRFHLGTHYSTSPFVFYFLMRQEPYDTLLVELQNYQQENPNRMFIGIKNTIEILESGNDNRELIPELFSKIEFFLNLNCAFFGYRINQKIVNNANINFMKVNDKSDISISDYVKLIFEHKRLLNSLLIGSNINDWINNIFGVGQLPNEKNRINCCNIFRKTTYEKYTNLIKKVSNYKSKFNKKYDLNRIKFKIANKINLIISFGQTPYQIFREPHPKKLYSLNNNNNLGFNKKYKVEEDSDDEKDILEEFSENILRPSSNKTIIRLPCIYFELNNANNKIFALTENEEIIDINFHKDDEVELALLTLSLENYISVPHIKFFDKIKIRGSQYYIYKPKYAFSSFKNKEENSNNNLPRKSSKLSKDSNNINKDNNFNFNIYYKNLFEDLNRKPDINEINNEISYKFIQCRYLDNTFKLFKITKIKNVKKKEKELLISSYSFICEDFVSSCCTISSNEFLTGLENGKLIKWEISEEQNNKIKINFTKNIYAHKNRINVIEVDLRLGLIVTGGNDNYIQIRKLHNLELITPIKINKKYIITMAKISHINFLYVMCFDKINKNSVLFGYTLTGIKFAKSESGYFCNIDFTRSGNIVSLLNYKEICILNGYDLQKKVISEEESGFDEFSHEVKKIEGSVWMEFIFFARKNSNEDSNIILYIKKGKMAEENMIYYHDFRENKIFE